MAFLNGYEYRSFVLVLSLLLAIASCHPKISPRLEDQLGKSSPQLTEKSVDSLSIVESSPIEEEVVQKAKEPYIMLRLEKTACYGECPVFEFTLYSDGKAIWHGMHYCERLGYYETNVPEPWRDQLQEKAHAISFFSLLQHYPAKGPYLSDLPTTIIYFNDGENEKSISQNYLTPLPLINYEKEIRTVADRLDWQLMDTVE